MKTFLQFREQAEFMRESSGSNIEKTLVKAVKVLALFPIPHYVCGGFAVQEHGYPRFTVDLISLKLSTCLGRGIHRIPDYADVVKLIEANHLPRDYDVDARVRDAYQKAWDEIQPT